ncbi:hypothetical protein KIPB_008160 [Kipferlia bialata]|uniref:Transmembrane protein n=1 Tax=Kipferlia bialata TaxID=797122 RepID=A0A391NN12_9EUKA|nr:hypothetical protein KIPB_008160 [Kipferlia bialata]|eukprot:g8160.t1
MKIPLSAFSDRFGLVHPSHSNAALGMTDFLIFRHLHECEAASRGETNRASVLPSLSPPSFSDATVPYIVGSATCGLAVGAVLGGVGAVRNRMALKGAPWAVADSVFLSATKRGLALAAPICVASCVSAVVAQTLAPKGRNK